MREHIMNLYISNHVIIGRLSEWNTLQSHHVHFTFQKCLVSKTNISVMLSKAAFILLKIQ